MAIWLYEQTPEKGKEKNDKEILKKNKRLEPDIIQNDYKFLKERDFNFAVFMSLIVQC